MIIQKTILGWKSSSLKYNSLIVLLTLLILYSLNIELSISARAKDLLLSSSQTSNQTNSNTVEDILLSKSSPGSSILLQTIASSIQSNSSQEPNTSQSSNIKSDLEERKFILEIIKTIGGFAFILTAYFAWKNLKLNEDKQVTERFSKAIELLAEKEKIESRLGALYILERIARDSKEDHPVVMEVLSEFVKANQNRVVVDSDTQAALTIIGRRKRRYDLKPINLESSYLHCADFRNAHLEQAILSRTELNNARFNRAYLDRAIFDGAEVESADFRGAFGLSEEEKNNLRNRGAKVDD